MIVIKNIPTKNIKKHTNIIIYNLLFCWLSVAFIVLSLNVHSAQSTDKKEISQQENQQKLTDIQQAIIKQESTILKKNQNRSTLEKQLRNDDLAISKIARAINDTNKKFKKTQLKISQLQREKQKLTQQKRSQENLLGQQLRTAYTTGQHDYLKLILNQKQTEKIQRSISYYQYLNQARMNEIEQFQTTLSNLLQVTTQHQEQIETLKSLKEEQSQQRITLNKTKKKRSRTLSALNKSLLSSKQKLAKLKAEENNLTYALKELEVLIQTEVNLTGLGRLKNKLFWPIKGRTLHRFGSSKHGYLKWKGVLIAGSIGKQVKTIHNGTILFADWLKGYGLVTVIDHGNGYMSLYGHNQTLLKSVGDRVETGEPIALVGQSGGQEESGLYFEIRHRGKAVNPKKWCR